MLRKESTITKFTHTKPCKNFNVELSKYSRIFIPTKEVTLEFILLGEEKSSIRLEL
jgi:hypothetical protein